MSNPSTPANTPQDFTKIIEIVNPPSKKDITEFYWEAEYIRDKISKIKNPNHYVLIQTLWMTGARISEILNLTKQDINLENNTILIKWEKNKEYKNRLIPLHPELKLLLQTYTAMMKPEERIFKITRQRAHQIVKKYLGGHPHKLRHSYAVHVLKNTNDIVLVKKLLGHKNINSTLVYTKYNLKDEQEKLNNISFQK
jgi:integrase